VIDTVAMLHAVLIVANVRSSINPYLFTLSLLDIMYPVTLISTAILVNVHPKSMSLIVQKLPNIDVTPAMPKRALATGLVVLPLPFVHGSILPFVDAVAISLLPLFLCIEYHLPFIF
jgi:hypothetical protein